MKFTCVFWLTIGLGFSAIWQNLVVTVYADSPDPRKVYEDPRIVSVGIQSYIDTGSATSRSVILEVVDETGLTVILTNTALTTAVVPKELRMVPGRNYAVKATSNSVNQFQFALMAPQGYKVVVDEIESMGVLQGCAGLVGEVNTYTIRLLDNGFMPFGQTSDLGVGKVRFTVGMGRLPNGDTAGVIRVLEDDMSEPLLAKRVVFESGSPLVDVVRITDPGDVTKQIIRQVRVPEGVVEVLNSGSQLIFKLWANSEVGSKSAGLWTFTSGSAPIGQFSLEHKTDLGGKAVVAGRERWIGSHIEEWSYLKEDGGTWTLVPWTNAEVTSYPTVNVAQITHDTSGSSAETRWKDGLSFVNKVMARGYASYSWGSELSSVTMGTAIPGSPQYYTNYSYNTSSQIGVRGQIATISPADGNWTRYDYYANTSDYPRVGKIKKLHRPFATTTISVPGSESNTTGVVSEFTYVGYVFASPAAVPRQYLYSKVFSEIQRHDGVQTGRVDYDYNNLGTRNGLPVVVTSATEYVNASGGPTTYTTTYAPTADFNQGYLTDKLHSVKRSDGTMTVYAYIRGVPDPWFRSIIPLSTGTWMQVVRIEGHSFAGSGSACTSYGGWSLESDFRVEAGRSKAYVQNWAPSGVILSEIVYVWSGSAWVLQLNDLHAHIKGLEGFRMSTTRWTSTSTTPMYTAFSQGFLEARPSFRTDSNGVTQQFYYDELGRLEIEALTAAVGASSPGTLWTHRTFDSANQITSERIAPGNVLDDGTHLLKEWHYDDAGRLSQTKQRAVDGASVSLLTTIHTPVVSANYRLSKITNPDGGEIFTEVNRDGSHKATYGSGARPLYTFYSVLSGGIVEKTTATTNSLTGMDWGSVQTDWLNRPIRYTQPNPAGGTSYELITYGENAGSCTCRAKIKSRQWFTSAGSPLLAATIYNYTGMGEVQSVGQDLNENGTLDLSSSDRVVAYTYGTQTAGSDLWLVVDKKTYTQPNNTTNFILETTKERLNGFSGSLRGQVQRYDANTNLSETTETVAIANALVRVETTVPGSSTSAYVETRNGFKTAERSSTGVTTTYTYDSLGRLSRTQGRDLLRADNVYYAGTMQVSAVRNAYLGASGNEWIAFEYDKMGRVVKRTAQPGSPYAAIVSRWSYTQRGELYRQWGSGENPVENIYDDAGRIITLKTYRGGTGVDNPVFPGGTADQTTYAYHSQAGTLTSVTDAASQTTTFTYNARRQVATRVAQRGVPSFITTTYTYSEASGRRTGEPTGVSYSDGTPGLTFSYDDSGGHSRFGRPVNVFDATGVRALGYRQTDGQLQYEWLDQGFFGVNGSSTGRDVWPTYATTGVVGRPTGYKVGWGSAQDDILSVAIGYQSTSGRIETITTGGGFGAKTFTYTYQAGGNRIASITSGSFVRSLTWQTWREAVDIDETKWGATSVSKIRYNYDWLGRRTNEINTEARAGVFGGTGWLSSTGFIHEWEYDSRSQVTNSKVHAAGSGGNPDTGSPTHILWRKWEFDPMGNKKSEWVANGSAETWNSNALNQATLTGTSTGMGSPTYDASGNLKQDTNWDYEYDAENRLKAIASRSVGNNDRFEYLYDYLGRRVRKQKMHKTTYVVSEDTRYLYVGWQLVAELNGLSLTGSPLRSYAWGIDAAGTLGGAGGTGALLMVKEDTTRQFAITDSRQNIRAYMNESGALTKAIEYTANGEIALEWNSTSAPTTTFGYASLYRDAESGMNYHHHRYYHPKLGKFISRDPIGVAGGINLYNYVGNGFVNSWDMLGLALFCFEREEVTPVGEFGIKLTIVTECIDIDIGGFFGGGSRSDGDNTVNAGSSPSMDVRSPVGIPASRSQPQPDRQTWKANKADCDKLRQQYPDAFADPGARLSLQGARLAATIRAGVYTELAKWEYQSAYYRSVDSTYYSYAMPRPASSPFGGGRVNLGSPTDSAFIGIAHSHSIGDYDWYKKIAPIWYGTPLVISENEYRSAQEEFSGNPGDLGLVSLYGHELTLHTPSGNLWYVTGRDAAEAALINGRHQGDPLPGRPSSSDTNKIIQCIKTFR